MEKMMRRDLLVVVLGLAAMSLGLAGCEWAGAAKTDANGADAPSVIHITQVLTGYVNILPDEVKSKLDAKEDFTLIDVRPAQQYQAGHISTAVSMPLAVLPWSIGSLDREKETIVYCQYGQASCSACDMLLAAGFKNVKSMVGGFSAWPYGVVSGNTMAVSL